jgi:NAD(P)-dependent dehydrogenase (short-subunit alcohol dehydrogenase family)
LDKVYDQIKREKGRIDIVFTNAGFAASIKATPAFSVYSATRAAARLFARSWTSDLKDRNIRVNAVSHGPGETPGLNRLVPEGQAEAVH